MKLDINEDYSDDIAKAELCLYAEVHLDGVKQEACVMADEEKGIIERYVKGPRGYESFNGHYLTEYVYGDVVIRDTRNMPRSPLTGFAGEQT